VNETVKLLVSPLASVSDDGDTATVKPAMPVTLGLTVSDPPLTLVTRRVTVCTPAMSPIAIDATLRLLGSIGVTPVQPPPGCTPQMKLSQSTKFESYTRPGLSAVFG